MGLTLVVTHKGKLVLQRFLNDSNTNQGFNQIYSRMNNLNLVQLFLQKWYPSSFELILNYHDNTIKST